MNKYVKQYVILNDPKGHVQLRSFNTDQAAGVRAKFFPGRGFLRADALKLVKHWTRCVQSHGLPNKKYILVD